MEATVYVLDAGPSMVEHSAQRVLRSLVLEKARSSKKNTPVALFLVGCDSAESFIALVLLGQQLTSGHRIAKHFHDMELLGNAYNNISQAWPSVFEMRNVHMDLIHLINEPIPCGAHHGDLLQALVLATDAIVRHCGSRKFDKRIVIITDGYSPCDEELIVHVCSQAIDQGITIDTIGFNFSHASVQDMEASVVNALNGEYILKRIAEATDGDVYCAQDILNELGAFYINQSSSKAFARTSLSIGDPTVSGSQIEFHVALYVKTYEVDIPRPLKVSPIAFETLNSPTESCNVKQQPCYRALTSNGKLDEANTTIYHENDLLDLYPYGSSFIPSKEVDNELKDYKTNKMFEIIAFVDASQFQPEHSMKHVHLILADSRKENAHIKFSALINAMADQNTVALARQVYRINCGPRLVGLIPRIRPHYEGFLCITLPFAEDYKTFSFTSLDFRGLSTLKPSVEQPNNRLLEMPIPKNFKPSDKQLKAAADFISALDLSSPSSSVDDHEQVSNKKPLYSKEVYHPVIRRLWNAIEFRSVNVTQPLPPPCSSICQQFDPPAALWHANTAVVRNFDEAFPTIDNESSSNRKKKTELKSSNSAVNSSTQVTSISVQLRSPSELSQSSTQGSTQSTSTTKKKVTHSISWQTSFQNVLNRTDAANFDIAISKMGEFALTFSRAGNDEEAISCIRTMRTSALTKNSEHAFNSFLLKLREINEHLWHLVKSSDPQVNFITQRESAKGISESEAINLLK